MTDEKRSERVSLDDHQAERLPPAFEQLAADLRADRTKLLKDKAFNDPAQLKLFVASHLLVRVEKMLRFLSGLSLETYQLAASNTTQLRNLHSFVVDGLNDLGADLDANQDIPGVSPDILDDFQQAFYTLGSVLHERFPGDEQLEGAYNACAQTLSAVIGDLMGDYPDDRDDDPDDDRADGDDRDDGDEDAEDAPTETPDAAEEGTEDDAGAGVSIEDVTT